LRGLQRDEGLIGPSLVTGGPMETTDESPALPSAEPAIQRVAGWLGATIIAAVPAIIALLHILILSRGDPQTARAILSYLDIVSLFLIVLLNLVSGGLLVAFFGAYRLYLRLRAPELVHRRLPAGTFWPLMMLGTIATVLTTNNYSFSLTRAGLGVVAAFLSASSRDFTLPPGLKDVTIWHPRIMGYSILGVTTTLSLAASLLFASANWRPLEVVKMSDGVISWVYVLDVGENHTTLLLPGGGVSILPNDAIDQRAVCPDRNPNGQHRSLLRLMLGGSGKGPKLCSDAPNPPQSRFWA
jgi:hypothetical protein